MTLQISFVNNNNYNGNIIVHNENLIIEFFSSDNSDDTEVALHRDCFNYLLAKYLPKEIQDRILLDEYDAKYIDQPFADVPKLTIENHHYYVLIRFRQPINTELFNGFLDALNQHPKIFDRYINEDSRAEMYGIAQTFFEGWVRASYLAREADKEILEVKESPKVDILEEIPIDEELISAIKKHINLIEIMKEKIKTIKDDFEKDRSQLQISEDDNKNEIAINDHQSQLILKKSAETEANINRLLEKQQYLKNISKEINFTDTLSSALAQPIDLDQPNQKVELTNYNSLEYFFIKMNLEKRQPVIFYSPLEVYDSILQETNDHYIQWLMEAKTEDPSNKIFYGKLLCSIFNNLYTTSVSIVPQPVKTMTDSAYELFFTTPTRRSTP